MAIVDPEISRRKLGRELDVWAQQAEIFRQRGYLIVAREDLRLDVGFLARLPLSSGPEPLAGMVACARLDFTNYDLSAPSVVFVDPFSGAPVKPSVMAFDHASPVRTAQGLPPNFLIDVHPQTGLPFLCHVGVREYHEHVEHNGDHWLLHRGEGSGTLLAICDLIWRSMVRNVVGFNVEVHAAIPPNSRAFGVGLLQADPEERVAPQAQAQIAAAQAGRAA
jgi:Predicted metal binding domain